ncbi:MAG: phosphoribosyltransferase, partial [Helicobacter sp.]|nr:phosphoribosyltransferase [Helicobacter sp.]
MRYYSYENFRDDMKILVSKLDETPDAIVAIARGGLTMGHFLGIALDIRNVFTINATLYFNKQKELLQISNIPSLEGHEKVIVVDAFCVSGGVSGR